MDTASNIKILAENGVQAEGSRSDTMRSQREALVRLWSWIERVESFCAEAEDMYAVDGVNLGWPAKGLIDAGAWRLLATDDGVAEDEEVFSESLCCVTYDSPGRRSVLKATTRCFHRSHDSNHVRVFLELVERQSCAHFLWMGWEIRSCDSFG